MCYYDFKTPFRVTRRLQARVPRVHDTYRYRTVVHCKTSCGDTHNHTKRVSLYKTLHYTQVDRRAAPHLHDKKGVLARRRAGGKHTKATLHCAVRRAQGGVGLHSGCHLRRCKRRQGAYRQEAGGRDCRSKRFGARAARRVRLRGEEGGVHTAWRAGSGPAEAARQAGMWRAGRGEREVRIVARSRCRLLQASKG